MVIDLVLSASVGYSSSAADVDEQYGSMRCDTLICISEHTVRRGTASTLGRMACPSALAN